MKQCRCGCGEIVKKEEHIFIYGHNRKNIKLTEEHKRKIGESNKIVKHNPMKEEVKKKLKEIHKSIENKGRFKKSCVPWNKNKKNPFSIFTIPEKHPMKRLENKIKQKIRAKEQWKNPSFVKKQMKSRGCKPNKTEVRFQDWLNKKFPNEWKFVGDGEFILGGKNPVYLNVNGKKKLLEIFGEHVHKEGSDKERISFFKKYGFETLVIWYKELRNIGEVEKKVKNFMEEEK